MPAQDERGPGRDDRLCGETTAVAGEVASVMGTLELAPGAIVAGKYRVLRQLGRGGMGVVFAAEHLELGAPVALKVLHTVGTDAVIERFRREAAIVARLRTEHVCRVLDAGTTSCGARYIAMELLEGRDLQAHLAASGPLGVRDAVDYVVQASEALAEAHAAGVVHRDVKPANLFLTRRVDGRPLVKVLDFGIAKMADGGRADLTGAAVIGSPRFMAPEQMRASRDVDARSDIWSLGAVLYQLLSGRPAFSATTSTELAVAVLQNDPRPLAAFRPDVPHALCEIVARCLKKDPAARFQSIAELSSALAPFAAATDGAGATAAAARDDPRIASPLQRAPTEEPATTFVPAPRRSRAAILAAIALIAALGVGVSWWAIDRYVSKGDRQATPRDEAASAQRPAVVLVGALRVPDAGGCPVASAFEGAGEGPVVHLDEVAEAAEYFADHGPRPFLYVVSVKDGPHRDDAALLRAAAAGRMAAVLLCDPQDVDDKELIALVGEEAAELAGTRGATVLEADASAALRRDARALSAYRAAARKARSTE